MTDFYKFKMVRISSEDAKGNRDTNTDFSVNLQGIIHPGKEKCLGVRLEQLVMGNYFYNIRSGKNNVFSFQEDGYARLNITLTPGFYNLTQIENILETEIKAYVVANVGGATDASVSENPITRKLEITLTGGTGSVIVDSISTASATLGFDQTTTSAATSIAQSSPRLFGLEQIYVECRDFAQNHLFDSKNSNFRPVMKVIQVDVGYGEKINYVNNNSSDRIVWGDIRNLNKIRFRLTNGAGEVLESQAESDHVKIILNFLYI